MIFLLYVNALLAMRYTVHVHHERVRAWIAALEAERGEDHVVFATCPITELGFVRVGSGKTRYAATVDSARDDLQDLKSSVNMLFIPDDVHAGYLPAWVRRSDETTDGYLLALAKAHGGKLATLDRFIPDAMLIPDETAGPLMVRDEATHAEWASFLRHSSADQTGSQEVAAR
jgi:uncharacterized protein